MESSNLTDLNPKADRPIAASEKAHLFNPRAKRPQTDFIVDESGEVDA
jgi:hypothetical protein